MPVTLCATCGTDELVGHCLKFQRTATAGQLQALGMRGVMKITTQPMDAQIRQYEPEGDPNYVRAAPVILPDGSVEINAFFTPITLTCPTVKADPIGPGAPGPQAEANAKK